MMREVLGLLPRAADKVMPEADNLHLAVSWEGNDVSVVVSPMHASPTGPEIGRPEMAILHGTGGPPRVFRRNDKGRPIDVTSEVTCGGGLP